MRKELNNTAEFKKSNLIEILEKNEMLSQDAWDFVDACMDDFFVDESMDGTETMYELRGLMWGCYDGTVEITQTYYSDIRGMAALIEHLSLMQKLYEKHRFGIPFDI